MPTSVKTQSKLLENLNQAQSKAVTFGNGPLLIIAGAGTGKTTVITRRIAWLIEQELAKPEEILALTFTEKAANEMLDRVDQLMPLGYAEIAISTFHAFAQRVLRDHALDIGIPSDFEILTQTQAWMLIYRNLSDFELDYYRPMGNPTKFIHALLDHFEKAKGEGVTPEKYLEHVQNLRLNTDETKKPKKSKTKPAATEQITEEQHQEIQRLTEVANAYHKYQKLLLDNSYLDYNDLITYTIELFKKRPKILAEFQNKFKYVLVDEFQDTDLVQYELVKMLAKPHNNITVVGDDDQSIYKFRGASISNILKFEDDYPKAQKISLTDNYRSAQSILDLSYDFIQLNNPERLESKLKISKKLKSHKPDQGVVQVMHAETVHDEAAAVVGRIIELQTKQQFSYNEFAILVRANDHAEPFLAELTKRQVPHMFVANRGLYKKPFILDLLAYFKLLDNYHESENLFRIMHLPIFKIDASDLVSITQTTKKKGLSLFEALKLAPMEAKISNPSKETIAKLLGYLQKHTALAQAAHVSEVCLQILNDLNLTQDLANNAQERSEDIGLLRKFYAKIQAYESDHDDKSLKGFLNNLKLEQFAGDTGELAFDPNVGPETVKIMTIHSSKGLEFECVFVTNMVEARFPSRDRKEQIALPDALVNEILSVGDVHLMEERRLFYVASTRAKTHLYLTWADNYGGVTNKKPSRFLVESGLESSQSHKPTGQVKFEKPNKAVKAKSKIPIPENFSWTSISSFLKCPLEFKYKYLYQLPWPGNPYTSFGSTIHKAIQDFSQHLIALKSAKQADLFGTPASSESKFEYPEIGVLLAMYDKAWIDDWYVNKKQQQEFKDRGKRLLTNFYNHLVTNKLMPHETEKFFKLKVGNYKYVGVIDAIFEHTDGTISIVDYKTSQKPRAKLEKVDKKQLLGYQLAALEFFGKKARSLAYWDLEDLSKIIPFVGTDQELDGIREELEANINEIVEAIKTDSFAELDKRKSHDCEFRDFVREN